MRLLSVDQRSFMPRGIVNPLYRYGYLNLYRLTLHFFQTNPILVAIQKQYEKINQTKNRIKLPNHMFSASLLTLY